MRERRQTTHGPSRRLSASQRGRRRQRQAYSRDIQACKGISGVTWLWVLLACGSFWALGFVAWYLLH